MENINKLFNNNSNNICMLCNIIPGVNRGVYDLHPLQQYFFHICSACLSLIDDCPAIRQSFHEMLYHQILDCKIIPMSINEIASVNKQIGK